MDGEGYGRNNDILLGERFADDSVFKFLIGSKERKKNTNCRLVRLGVDKRCHKGNRLEQRHGTNP